MQEPGVRVWTWDPEKKNQETLIEIRKKGSFSGETEKVKPSYKGAEEDEGRC